MSIPHLCDELHDLNFELKHYSHIFYWYATPRLESWMTTLRTVSRWCLYSYCYCHSCGCLIWSIGLISCIYSSRPALRLYQVHHVDASVGSPASSHKCGGGDYKCGQARVGPRWSSIILQLLSLHTHSLPYRQLSPQAVTARPNYKWAGRKPVSVV